MSGKDFAYIPVHSGLLDDFLVNIRVTMNLGEPDPATLFYTNQQQIQTSTPKNWIVVFYTLPEDMVEPGQEEIPVDATFLFAVILYPKQSYYVDDPTEDQKNTYINAGSLVIDPISKMLLALDNENITGYSNINEPDSSKNAVFFQIENGTIRMSVNPEDNDDPYNKEDNDDIFTLDVNPDLVKQVRLVEVSAANTYENMIIVAERPRPDSIYIYAGVVTGVTLFSSILFQFLRKSLK